nr:protein ACCELERATED CELL DEATH 6-like [Ipomoea batatas]GMD52149.1 protein ACCELERATED CELL DEATH 6-like [Ipomoea batatas]
MLAVIDCSIMHGFITKRPMLNYFAFNKKHQTLFDIAFLERNKLDIGYEKLIKGKRTLLNSRKFADRMIQNPEHRVNIIPTEENRLEAIIGMGKSSIVVATLILTMTFAAGITVPGGYHQEKGYPLLLRKAAFKAFITTNTFSFLCSFCSIAVHIAMVSEASRYLRSFETVARLNFLQGALLLYSCYGVVIAFLCAMYATLAPLRPLAIADLILGFTIVIIAYCVYRLLWLCGCRPPY